MFKLSMRNAARSLRGLAAAAVLCAMTFSQPALAQSATFDFSVDGSSSGLGSGPYASVTVTQSGGSLVFLQTLSAPYRIHDGNTNHSAFAFRIIGDPAITITNLTPGFQALNLTAGSNQAEPPFGDFFTVIDCTTACGAGYGGGYTGQLGFTVSSTSALTLASLGFNQVGTNSIYFTSDLVQAQGLTGNVGATLRAVPSVPEPSTWAMMLFGFGAMGVSLRRRRRGQALLQAA